MVLLVRVLESTRALMKSSKGSIEKVRDHIYNVIMEMSFGITIPLMAWMMQRDQ